jgi:YkoY family integral membrane protein
MDFGDPELVHAASIVATLFVLEAVLSFDNAAILAVMSRRLPAGASRKRALNYGLAIAYGLRLLAIFLVQFLLSFAWFLTIGGLYLVFLFLRHFVQLARHKGSSHMPATGGAKGLWGLTPFGAVILQIGLIDLAFALDQVVAAVAFTKDEPNAFWLIVIAATAGLVSLRLLAPVMSRLMDWLPLLEHMAFVAVGFVGTLLVLDHPFDIHPIGKTEKILATLGLFVVPVVVKVLFGWPKSHPGQHRIVEQALEGSNPPLDGGSRK